jgi:hypothetical protein
MGELKKRGEKVEGKQELSSAQRRRMSLRIAGALLTLLCVLWLCFKYYGATAFPIEAPIRKVDAALVARLRANPGLHLALQRSYVIEVPIVLEEDTQNRFLFGTEVDLREAVPRYSVHIQRKGDRTAIHVDSFNPRAGLLPWFMHHTIEVPVIPVVLAFLIGLFIAIRR